MQVPLTDPSLKPPLRHAQDWPGPPEIPGRETRNLLLLVAHQVVLCVGWIFKTESVIIPAFVDYVAGPGWIRGLLPVLNRLGQSVPPVLSAEYVRSLRRKKGALVAFTLLMSLPFAALSLLWFAVGTHKEPWLIGAFLILYFLFCVADGLYLMSFGTVQGKLIRPARRGLLLSAATFGGSPPAILAAWLLLDRWLGMPDGGFGYIFAFTATCFFLSGLIAAGLAEPADAATRLVVRPQGNLQDTVRTLREDANLRCLVVVAMLFGSGLIVIPHYQALARQHLGLGGVNFMAWVIVHNLAVGVCSLAVGPLADRHGNRLTLRVLIFGSAIAPALASLLPALPRAAAVNLFWVVFLPLGITPLVLRIVQNYALEICPSWHHPRYVSITNLCLVVPFLFSPLVGWLIDAAGFQIVFASTAAVLALGGLLTFRLDEPRHHRLPDDVTLSDPGFGFQGAPSSHDA